MSATDRGAATLHTTTYGSTGPPVVFLHGLFGQGKNFTSLAKELAGEARVTLLDLPDHGRSPWSTALSYPAIAEAVAATLTTRGTAPTAVVGHSMGGKVGMALALLRPELVERLCVVDVAPVPTGAGSSFAAYVRAMRAVDLHALRDRREADAALLTEVPDPTVRQFLLQNLRRGADGWHWQMNLDLLGDELETVMGWPDLTLPPYRVEPYPGPVLWVRGADSDYIRPEHAPLMRALFPRVQSVAVKNAGHWVHADQPQVVAALLRRWLHP